MRKARKKVTNLLACFRYHDPGQQSKYISNFGRQLSYLRVCRLICGFTARWFASFAAADRHLTEQRRNGPADETIM
jgi:AbiV family abortive infection protein